jgi:hypothetical protein
LDQPPPVLYLEQLYKLGVAYSTDLAEAVAIILFFTGLDTVARAPVAVSKKDLFINFLLVT